MEDTRFHSTPQDFKPQMGLIIPNYDGEFAMTYEKSHAQKKSYNDQLSSRSGGGKGG